MLKKLFGDREFNKKLLSVMLPIAFQQFMLALVGVSDAVMLGFVSQASMSAVSLATQISFVENLFFAAMTIGLSVMVAQYWGKGDYAVVGEITGYVIRITTAISFLFFLFALVTPQTLMELLTNDKDLVIKGAEYLRVNSLALLITGVSQILLCLLKNTGRVKATSLISSFSVIINIILNGIFIFGLLGVQKLGIVGAAIATVIARVVELIWCCLELRRHDKIDVTLKSLFYIKETLKKAFWKYTTPVLGNEIVWGVGFTMSTVIIGHLGADAVAANSIANIVKNLLVCFCTGLGSGGAIIVGNMLGRGNLTKAKEYGDRLLIFSVLLGIATGLVLYSSCATVLECVKLTLLADYYLARMLKVCSIYMVGKSINGTLIAGIFCAGGDSKFGFWCDAITLWGVVVPLGMIAAFLLEAPVLMVYVIVSMDEIIKLPAVIVRYKKYKWVKNITEA